MKNSLNSSTSDSAPAGRREAATKYDFVQLAPDLFLYPDTCNVYILRHAERATLVDCGDGSVLDHLDQLGITAVSDVLITHYHRDNVQGLPRLAAAGARLWAPESEREFFEDAEQRWQARPLRLDYDVRQDRFASLESAPLHGLLADYSWLRLPELDGLALYVLPTPGHTPGSISLLFEKDGLALAFCGDLIAGPGQLWSLAATQWTYTGGEGLAASVVSLLELKRRGPHLLLPSHGRPMNDPGAAIDVTIARLEELMRLRNQNRRLFELYARPYEALSPHLLRNRASVANSYVLLSDSGAALLLDFGYDFVTGQALTAERATRRPSLLTLPALRSQFGVSQIEAVLPTHAHDDHVAGLNLLRRVEGAQVWAAPAIADVLEEPQRFNLPCLWVDPIPVDRRLPLEQPFHWREYTLQLFPLPGHVYNAVAILLEVDGQRVLATGDQDEYHDGLYTNYVYANGFESGDFVASAELYARLQPDLLLPGHWDPVRPTPELLDGMQQRAAHLQRLHKQLLHPDVAGFGAAGWALHIEPYTTQAAPGARFQLTVAARSPLPHPAPAVISLQAPPGWRVEPAAHTLELEPGADARMVFAVSAPPGLVQRRARLAASLTVAGRKYGQQAEALVDLVA